MQDKKIDVTTKDNVMLAFFAVLVVAELARLLQVIPGTAGPKSFGLTGSLSMMLLLYIATMTHDAVMYVLFFAQMLMMFVHGAAYQKRTKAGELIHSKAEGILRTTQNSVTEAGAVAKNFLAHLLLAGALLTVSRVAGTYYFISHIAYFLWRRLQKRTNEQTEQAHIDAYLESREMQERMRRRLGE